MKVILSKRFRRDFDKIRDKKLKQVIADSVQSIEAAHDIRDIKGLLKLKGYKNLYRIRTPALGSYRIVLSYEKDKLVLILIRVLHRRDIYRKN